MSVSSSTSAPRRSFRLVCAPEHRERVEDLLRQQGFVFVPEPFSPFCRRLIDEPFPLGRSVAAFFGLLYIQDRSSMLPPLALALEEGSHLLDLCASPGSKTGFAAQLIGSCGLVLANEPSRQRLATLRQNLALLNLWNCATASWPGEEFPGYEQWDAILLDPPCSGWGTTDKHPGMVRQWTGERVKPLLTLQRHLLQRAAELLAPSGRLVYSTCTTNENENEAQILWALNETDLRLLPLSPFPGFGYADPVMGCDGVLRVDEAASEAQGFFVALLEKPGQRGPDRSFPPPPDATTFSLTSPLAANWHLDPTQLPPGCLVQNGKDLHFHPLAANSLAPALRWQGLPMGAGTPTAVPNSHVRTLTEEGPLPLLRLDTLADLQGLMQGQSLRTGLHGGHALLFWHDLPLGRVRLKAGRAIWSER